VRPKGRNHEFQSRGREDGEAERSGMAVPEVRMKAKGMFVKSGH